ncbi:MULTISPECIES: MBOAT family O-acyltransferase [unclassified Barnesiella]|uniref:MBOAT family O-acyltransferase n=1 Tax=unclassified Barnesiella TaxID=2645177 RepID=UPI001F14C050|nr:MULTISPECIES: MBOAT family O-acyltransferase [unclassified Barnesiella]MCR8912332.1 MBOAT family protein [Barnesiella sp. ET7]
MSRFQEQKWRKTALVSGIVINLGILFFYKYYEFAGSLITDFFSWFGIGISIPQWNVLLPVGISFYIFQAVGYAVDVYRGTIKAEKNFIVYALFISFFPQLVAGPIERARNMLPQFKEKHKFSYENFDRGLRWMLWGFFMKLCVADRISTYVDAVYNNYMEHSGTSLLLATFFFTFQIYCDFAGYSLIAIGSSRIMGFHLMENFHRPYFSRSIKEFWRRWHISLSTWFKDYLYIPLGGNRVSHWRHLWNLFVTFLVSGIWHGANLTFVLWGTLHGLYQVVGIEKNRLLPQVKAPRKLHAVLNCLVTFVLVMFAWIFFRTNDLHSAFEIIGRIFTHQGALFTGEGIPSLLLGFMCIGILMLKELKDELSLKIYALDSPHYGVRIASMSLFLAFIILSASFDGGAFIYFQF